MTSRNSLSLTDSAVIPSQFSSPQTRNAVSSTASAAPWRTQSFTFRAGPGNTSESAMEISKRHVGDITILDLQGKLMVGGSAELLRDTVASIVFQGDRKVVLNLAGVPYIDSSGLGELVRCSLILQREKGAIRLVNLTSKITNLLAITKLLTVFDTFDSEPAALGSFETTKV